VPCGYGLQYLGNETDHEAIDCDRKVRMAHHVFSQSGSCNASYFREATHYMQGPDSLSRRPLEIYKTTHEKSYCSRNAGDLGGCNRVVRRG